MNLSLLYREKVLTNHQFPTVKALNDPPTSYEGLLRCERGEVKKLADEGIWPFVEYVSWNKFNMDLPAEYPLRPPTVTWLADVSHPNIVPNVPSAVCVSILGNQWKPTLGLASVINSCYYLLADPNPNNAFDHPRCLKAAEVCRKYGFPKMAEDFVTFRIQRRARARARGDVMRFKVPKRRSSR